jgi:hypothetical protein
MPRGDRTGPMGMGPMTGRAAGLCAGYPGPGYMYPYGGGRLPYRGFGRGRGRGTGWRQGFGRGWGRNFNRQGFGIRNAYPYHAYTYTPYSYPASPYTYPYGW